MKPIRVTVRVLLLVCSSHAVLAAPTTTRINVSTGGVQADSYSDAPRLSADGRFVAFRSAGTNLVAGDTNGKVDVFLRDRQTNTTVLVSVASDGTQSNGNSGNQGLDISADGRYVVFTSDATNLVPGDTNVRTDIFLRDTVARTTTLVSVATSGARSDANSFFPSISADGTRIAFQSHSSTFAPGYRNYLGAVFLRDTAAGTTTLASLSDDGRPWQGAEPSLSADGGSVAFTCWPSGLAAGDANGHSNVYVRDMVAGKTVCTTAGSDGDSRHPALSGDGKRVAFFSFAKSLGGSGRGDVFLHDLTANAAQLVSSTPAGVPGNGVSGFAGAAISGNGRYVAFASTAPDLVAGDANGYSDVFVRDTQASTTMQASLATSGTPAETECTDATLSADGRYAAFATASTNLATDKTTNISDIYVRGPFTAGTQAYQSPAARPLAKVTVARVDATPSPLGVESGAVVWRDASSRRVIAIRDSAPQPGETPRQKASALLWAHAKDLGLSDPDTELAAYREETDGAGVMHIHYAQRYKGLPVVGGGAVVHTGAGAASIGAGLSAGVALDTTPTVAREVAEQTARAAFIRQYPQTGPPLSLGTTLVVYDGALLENASGSRARLAWAVDLRDGPCAECPAHADETYLVDGQSGELLGSLSNVRHSGTKRWVYDCTTRGWDSVCWANKRFTDHFPDYVFGRSEGKRPRGVNPVYGGADTDSLFGLLGSANYLYQATFGRNGANNRCGLGSGGMYGSLPYPADETWADAYSNADPSWTCPNAVFTKGVLAFCHGDVVPDTVGHEYSHGIPFYTFNQLDMVYSGESGALDECFSDVMGETVENFVTGVADWIAGTGAPGGDSIPRSLKDPPSGHRSQPDKLFSPWVFCGDWDNGGVHLNSTIPSKSMYLASEGGTFNGVTITGIGFGKVQQILYRAMTLYYVPSETFNQAYIAIQQSASDLFSDADCWQVKKALQAVELDQQSPCSGGVERTPYAAAPFTAQDMGRALQLAGGLTAARPEDLGRLDVALTGNSFLRVDMRDALSVARKVTGLEANP